MREELKINTRPGSWRPFPSPLGVGGEGYRALGPLEGEPEGDLAKAQVFWRMRLGWEAGRAWGWGEAGTAALTPLFVLLTSLALTCPYSTPTPSFPVHSFPLPT